MGGFHPASRERSDEAVRPGDRCNQVHVVHTPAMLEVLSALTRLRDLATDRVRARVTASSIDREQLAAHALAYLSTEVEACGKLAAWAEPLGAHEQAIAAAYVGEVAR